MQRRQTQTTKLHPHLLHFQDPLLFLLLGLQGCLHVSAALVKLFCKVQVVVTAVCEHFLITKNVVVCSLWIG